MDEDIMVHFVNGMPLDKNHFIEQIKKTNQLRDILGIATGQTSFSPAGMKLRGIGIIITTQPPSPRLAACD